MDFTFTLYIVLLIITITLAIILYFKYQNSKSLTPTYKFQKTVPESFSVSENKSPRIEKDIRPRPNASIIIDRRVKQSEIIFLSPEQRIATPSTIIATSFIKHSIPSNSISTKVEKNNNASTSSETPSIVTVKEFKPYQPNLEALNPKELQRLINQWPYRHLSHEEIGAAYEQYIGYVYNQRGYSVHFYGQLNGLADRGIDLIAHNKNETLLIQCKCWSKNKLIRENTITQLYGALGSYRTRQTSKSIIKAILITTTDLDQNATQSAQALGIEVSIIEFDKKYPRIKLNDGARGKIYHTPFSPYYDQLRLPNGYVNTLKEAEALGYRSHLYSPSLS